MSEGVARPGLPIESQLDVERGPQSRASSAHRRRTDESPLSVIQIQDGLIIDSFAGGGGASLGIENHRARTV
jgi:hypothetical protein